MPAFSESWPRPRSAWTVTWLLTVLALINFVDKIVLGLVAVPLSAELQLSPEKFGLIAGSFFWLFSTSTVLVGFVSNRVPTRWLLLAMGISWALLQIPQAIATSALGLLVCRVLLGAAEGPSFPVSVHALYKWFPDRKRNLPVAIINQGAAVGLLLAGLLIPLVSRHWGWRTNFLLLGAVGAAWSVLWLVFGREGPTVEENAKTAAAGSNSERRVPASAAATAAASAAASAAAGAAARLPYRKILGDPSVLCVFALGFSAYWTLGLSLSWLPTYLEKGLGYNGVEAGRGFAIVVASATPVNLGLSWLSQRMLGRGASTRRARVHPICLSAVVAASIYLVPMLVDLAPLSKVALLALACALPTLIFALAPALLAEIVPDVQRGALVAIHTAIASLGAALAPMVMGRIVQAYGSTSSHAYELGYAINAVLLVAAALAALRWLHPARSQTTLERIGTRATA